MNVFFFLFALFVALPADNDADTLPVTVESKRIMDTNVVSGDSNKLQLHIDSASVEEHSADFSEDEAEVDKESLSYKIGYQIGSWLIPGILMIIVTIMIFRRSRRGKNDTPEL